jgi:hypothetical protein
LLIIADWPQGNITGYPNWPLQRSRKSSAILLAGSPLWVGKVSEITLQK